MKRDYDELSLDGSQSSGGCDHCSEKQNVRNLPELKKRRMVIEKKRRDRINKYLEELSQLVPAAAEKAEASKIEKAEILEMTVEYLKSFTNDKKVNTIKDAPLEKLSETQTIKKPSTDEREVGFWNCANRIHQFLESTYHGDEKGLFLPGLQKHLNQYANTKLSTISDIKSPFGTSSNSTSNPFQHLGKGYQKICMDFLKNNCADLSPPPTSHPISYQQHEPQVLNDSSLNQQTFQYDVLLPATQSYQMFPINEYSP